MHERALVRLRQLEALAGTIALLIGPGITFSAAELFDSRLVRPELAAMFDVLEIHSTRQLGKRLRSLCGSGLQRVGQDNAGAVWVCS